MGQCLTNGNVLCPKNLMPEKLTLFFLASGIFNDLSPNGKHNVDRSCGKGQIEQEY